jgi:hypothetical protein
VGDGIRENVKHPLRGSPVRQVDQRRPVVQLERDDPAARADNPGQLADRPLLIGDIHQDPFGPDAVHRVVAEFQPLHVTDLASDGAAQVGGAAAGLIDHGVVHVDAQHRSARGDPSGQPPYFVAHAAADLQEVLPGAGAEEISHAPLDRLDVRQRVDPRQEGEQPVAAGISIGLLEARVQIRHGDTPSGPPARWVPVYTKTVPSRVRRAAER